MQDGGHIALGANENIVFLIAYTISYPKIIVFILSKKFRRNYIVNQTITAEWQRRIICQLHRCIIR